MSMVDPDLRRPDTSRSHKPAERADAVRTRFTRLHAHAPDILAVTAAVLGLALVLDVVLPDRWESVRFFAAFLPQPAAATANALTIIGGWLLLRVARGLRKRRRIEWRLAVVICFAVVVIDVVGATRRPIEAVVTLALLVGLLLSRRRFVVTAGPVGRWLALRLGISAILVAVAFVTALTYLPHRVYGHPSFLARLGEAFASLVGAGGWIPLRGDRFADLVHAGLVITFVAVVVAVLLTWLKPVSRNVCSNAADQDALRTLLAKQGARDSLGYFALRDDKATVWSPTGKAAITYRALDGVALASADPIGDPEAWPGAIAEFRRLVEEHGWTPAVMGCSELGATVYQREYGLKAIALGDEAVVDVASFSLSGRSMRGVRQAVNRVARAGYSVRVDRVGDLVDADFDELRRAADAWRVDPVERGFSMALSRLGEPGDEDCLVVRAYRTAPDGDVDADSTSGDVAGLAGEPSLQGLLHFVPWSTDGLSLDLMRRDRAADNGLNEFMITRLVEVCSELGVHRVSLNFAVFREALERGERIGAGPVLRAWRKVLLVASKWWQIESLYRFNDKFEPQWQPRFFSYTRARDLPRITLAALEAEAFVVRPKLLLPRAGR